MGVCGASSIITTKYIGDGINTMLPWLVALTAVVLADLAAGCRKSLKLGVHVSISTAARETMGKLVVYWSFVLMVASIEVATGHKYSIAMWGCLLIKGLAHNTIVGRLRQWRAVMGEAQRRKITENTGFEEYPIGRMESKHGYLTEAHLKRLEAMSLDDKQSHVRDAFLFCCWTGLRFSDFVTLKKEHLKDNWIVKKMEKTGYVVEVPLDRIFEAKAQAMINRYGDIETLSQGLQRNSQVNKTLHNIFDKLDLDFKPTFHTSRHTFATLLLQQGIPMTAIQQMLGHRKIETTQIYGERDRKTLEGQLKRVNRKSNKTTNRKDEH